MTKVELTPSALGAHFFNTLTSDEQLPAYKQTTILFRQFIGFTSTHYFEDMNAKERELNARCMNNLLGMLYLLHQYEQLPSRNDLFHIRNGWRQYANSRIFETYTKEGKEVAERVFASMIFPELLTVEKTNIDSKTNS